MWLYVTNSGVFHRHFLNTDIRNVNFEQSLLHYDYYIFSFTVEE